VSNRVIKDDIWTSKKLARCSLCSQLHFPRLYLLVDDWSCLEIDYEVILGKAYPKLRKKVRIITIKACFADFEDNGLLFTWTVQDRLYGYFTGKEEGRLPAPTRRHKRQTPEPPQQALEQYINYFSKLDEEPTRTYKEGTKRVQSTFPNPNHKPNPNPNHIKEGSSKKLASPKDKDNGQDKYKNEIFELVKKMEMYWPQAIVWARTKRKEKIKETAVYYALLTVEKKRPKGPWAFAEGILREYNDSELFQKEDMFGDVIQGLKELQRRKEEGEIK